MSNVSQGPSYTCAATTVTTSYTTIGEAVIAAGSAGEVFAEIANTGAALTGFRIQCLDTPKGTWFSYLSGTDFTPAGANDNVLASHGSGANYVNTLGSGETANIRVDLHGCYAFRFQAICGTSTSVTVKGGRKTER